MLNPSPVKRVKLDKRQTALPHLRIKKDSKIEYEKRKNLFQANQTWRKNMLQEISKKLV